MTASLRTSTPELSSKEDRLLRRVVNKVNDPKTRRSTLISRIAEDAQGVEGMHMLTIIRTKLAAEFGGEGASMVTDFDPHKLEAIDAHIGRRIRSRRRILSLNQSELARRIGVTFQQVHKYETGQSSITAARLFAIATALGVTFDFFYDDMPL